MLQGGAGPEEAAMVAATVCRDAGGSINAQSAAAGVTVETAGGSAGEVAAAAKLAALAGGATGRAAAKAAGVAAGQVVANTGGSAEEAALEASLAVTAAGGSTEDAIQIAEEAQAAHSFTALQSLVAKPGAPSMAQRQAAQTNTAAAIIQAARRGQEIRGGWALEVREHAASAVVQGGLRSLIVRRAIQALHERGEALHTPSPPGS